MTPEQTRSHLGHLRSLHKAGIINGTSATVAFYTLHRIALEQDWYRDVAHSKLRLELEGPIIKTETI